MCPRAWDSGDERCGLSGTATQSRQPVIEMTSQLFQDAGATAPFPTPDALGPETIPTGA